LHAAAQAPFRPASTPSLPQRTSGRGNSASATPSSVPRPTKRPRRAQGGAAAAAGRANHGETAAGAFDAAAARASRPNYRDYDKAEQRAGLAGEGAQVQFPPSCPPKTAIMTLSRKQGTRQTVVHAASSQAHLACASRSDVVFVTRG
jgi:hypothetical protein